VQAVCKATEAKKLPAENDAGIPGKTLPQIWMQISDRIE